ncbi:MAG: tRNA threonylcarbamoyl adenosine modification protein YeaZ [Pseudomonadota bacterium]|jgi:tRNA threonylcarbamoyladenosine biosynthesis protein TsaB
MSTILAIETSTEIASVALLHDGKLWQQAASGVQNHSLSVLPMVQSLLQQAALTLADCHAIAFGAGPGSFTGVRTACGLAQGLAFGLNLPVLPVSTLLALAEGMRQARSGADMVMPVLDARMGEVYWAQYRYQDGWQEVHAPALAKPQDLVCDLQQVAPCGNGASLCGFDIGEAPQLPHAAQIAQLGALALAQGLGLDAAQAQPFYLRNKVAQTSAERLQNRGAA